MRPIYVLVAAAGIVLAAVSAIRVVRAIYKAGAPWTAEEPPRNEPPAE